MGSNKKPDLIGGIFALFVFFALFLSYEPTAKIIEQIVGGIITALFIGIVIGIVAIIIYFFYFRDRY